MLNNKSNLYHITKKYENKIITWRRHIHQNPELGFEEFETTKYIVEQLKEIGISDIKVGTNNIAVGVIANLKVKNAKKTIALRADMDALPITENNTCEYASTKKGLMHACGHDSHVAMLLGACAVLKEMAENNQLENNVRFIFQPAEETTGGAEIMIKEGAMENVDKVYALHISSGLDSGVIGYKAGPITAAPDKFVIKIHGKGGHGACPNCTKDPIIVAGAIITSAQSIISREVDPFEPVVLSITYVKAGTAYNIIPNSAELMGTVRTITNERRDYMEKRFPQMIQNLAEAHNCSVEVEYTKHFPPTINDPQTTATAVEILKNEFGDNEYLTEIQPSMGGEDFSYFTQTTKGSFIRLGSKSPDPTTHFPHHHPNFNIDETALIKGTIALSLLALN